MNFNSLFKAYDAVVAFRDATRRFKGLSSAPQPPETSLSQSAAAQGLAGQIETRLTNVVVAALKEAFDRDTRRLELERATLEGERERAERALRLELRRQAGDREIGRLRLLAGIAVASWIGTLFFSARALGGGVGPRLAIGAAWLLLLVSFAAAFVGQLRVAESLAHTEDRDLGSGTVGAVALWSIVGGLALVGLSVLIA